MKTQRPKTNFQLLTEQTISEIQKRQTVPTLLLHCCCAPCASYCLTYLSQFFDISVYFFNPNIFPEGEYNKRFEELKRLCSLLPTPRPFKILECDYAPEKFIDCSVGLENSQEGGQRCKNCFSLRLNQTAETAEKLGFDYFCTTLTVGPRKDEQLINATGYEAAKNKNTLWLPSDFKKKDGYLKSVELSAKYGLYRQNFCGCIYSAAACEINI